MGTAVTRIVPIGLLLLTWEVITRAGWINPFVFPPVSEIAVRWVSLFADGTMVRPLMETLWRALLGLAAAIVVGVPLGSHSRCRRSR
jgi:sulfonate transport system permease protein